VTEACLELYVQHHEDVLYIYKRVNFIHCNSFIFNYCLRWATTSASSGLLMGGLGEAAGLGDALGFLFAVNAAKRSCTRRSA
jgi:hypothetical protein